MSKLPKWKRDLFVEQFKADVDRNMDYLYAAGVPASDVTIAAEEAAVNWTKPKLPRKSRKKTT